MKPFAQLETSNIKGIFSDLDDTITEDSKIPGPTYQALWNLKAAGFCVAIVSGRPAGWADCLMRLWPIDYMVFENGAGIMARNGKKITVVNLADTQSLANQMAVLKKHFDHLKKEMPHLRLASDQPYRLFDIAIDYAEEPPGLTSDEVEKVMRYLQNQKGITAKLSSIHINYWCGEHTKVTACEYLLKKLEMKPFHILYAGDSPNDEPLFSFFPNSVGVANVQRYISILKTPPAYVTKNPSSRGFEEIASHLLTRATKQ